MAFGEGTVVVLSASSGANTKPVVWNGCDEVTGANECKVTMSAAKEVTATFALEQHLLSVTKGGCGSGAVTSSPAGIDCGSTCAASFDHGAEVTLTASAAGGSEFKGWSGACTGTGACTVTIGAAAAVVASFEAATVTPPVETPTPTPPGSSPAPAETVPAGNRGLVNPPVTVDGPSSEIVDFGGVAMAPRRHRRARLRESGRRRAARLRLPLCRRPAGARRSGSTGTSPTGRASRRSRPGPGGELLVVWVDPGGDRPRQDPATASTRPASARGLELRPLAAGRLQRRRRDRLGVDPSLSATSPGKAIVAYRVITYRFNGSLLDRVQLRPGDVMADIRVARLNGDRWSRLGAINRNPEASMRPPSATNGPQVGAGVDGGAVVAWQEPDQTGTARIWMRRIFGTALGPILQASPCELGGRSR